MESSDEGVESRSSLQNSNVGVPSRAKRGHHVKHLSISNLMNLPKAHSDTYGYGPRQQMAYSPTMR